MSAKTAQCCVVWLVTLPLIVGAAAAGEITGFAGVAFGDRVSDIQDGSSSRSRPDPIEIDGVEFRFSPIRPPEPPDAMNGLVRVYLNNLRIGTRASPWKNDEHRYWALRHPVEDMVLGVMLEVVPRRDNFIDCNERAFSAFIDDLKQTYQEELGADKQGGSEALSDGVGNNILVACTRDVVRMLYLATARIENVADERIRRREWRESAAGRQSILAGDICREHKGMLRFQGMIEREREIGEISGAVNLSNLNRAGRRILQYRERRDQAHRAYEGAYGPFDIEARCN